MGEFVDKTASLPRAAGGSVFVWFASNLNPGGKGREPIGHPVEGPCLQGFIKSGHDEDSQTQHDDSEPLLAYLAGVQ